jgi:hypothetical protein
MPRELWTTLLLLGNAINGEAAVLGTAAMVAM